MEEEPQIKEIFFIPTINGEASKSRHLSLHSFL